jgi:hypothetical protein
MTYSDPSSPSSNERTTPRGRTPTPLERGKKTDKKLETPVLIAIISAVVTLTTSILGSPLLSTLINKTDSPASTSAAELVVSQNSLLPDNLPGGELFKATLPPTERGTGIIEFTSTPQEENPAALLHSLSPLSPRRFPYPKNLTLPHQRLPRPFSASRLICGFPIPPG